MQNIPVLVANTTPIHLLLEGTTCKPSHTIIKTYDSANLFVPTKQSPNHNYTTNSLPYSRPCNTIKPLINN